MKAQQHYPPPPSRLFTHPTSPPPLPVLLRFVTYQIIVNLASSFKFQGSHGYPSPFKEIMDALSGIFTIDFVGVLHVDCLGRTDFEDKLLASTLVPIGLFLLEAAYHLGRSTFVGGNSSTEQRSVISSFSSTSSSLPHASTSSRRSRASTSTPTMT